MRGARLYTLTVDGGELLGGTLTFDTSFAPTTSSGGIDTYTQADDAIVDFSFFRAGSLASFDKADGGKLTLTMATVGDAPLTLWIDIDDSEGDFLFTEGGTPGGAWPATGGGLDFETGSGLYQPGDVNVTGASLTPPTLPTPPPSGLVIIIQ
jgi:hypothetical protein